MSKRKAIEQTPELRRTGLGGSDMAAVMNLNPYKSPVDVWLEKVGEAKPEDENDLMWFGKQVEYLVAEYFTRRTGQVVRSVHKTVRHPQHEFLMAHPDRTVNGTNEGLEIKSGDWYGRDQWGDEGSDEIPEQYLPQVHFYNMVCNFKGSHVAVLIGRDLKLYYVPRSTGWDEALIDAGVEFWQSFVLPKVMPPIVEWNAIAQRALKRAYPLVDPTTVRLADDKIMAMVELQREITAKVKDQEAALKGIDAHLREFAQNNEFVLLPDGRCLRKIAVAGADVPSYYRDPYTYLREVKAPKGLHIPAIAITQEKTDE